MIIRPNNLTALFICILCLLINTAHAETDRLKGKVINTMNASGYTYVEVDTGENKVWAAGPVTPIKVGQQIEFLTRMPMHDFQSKSLNRTFPIVYFVPAFITENETTTQSISQATAKDIEHFTKAKDGNTINEIHNQKNTLAGKIVRIRGQVTKFTPNILNKNWLHIRDSSSSNDLTITTSSKVDVGDIVIVSGKLELNKDFGYGYVYPVIIEDANIINK